MEQFTDWESFERGRAKGGLDVHEARCGEGEYVNHLDCSKVSCHTLLHCVMA